MKPVYLDNAATSYPKAPGCAESIVNFINNIGSNVNRGTSSYEAENVLFETREIICELFNFNTPENVIFTKNITESLNVIIKGLLRKGDHAIVSSMEHNSVMRPLNTMNKLYGVEYSRVMCSENGNLNINELKKQIKENTKAVIITHASNVCGTILPMEKIGEICREKDIFFIIDSAQTAGAIELDFDKLNCDAITFTGHKGLLGPQGIGGFLLNDKLSKVISPLIEGGTGSVSDSEIQPDYMPDKFESGTPNLPGIFGLNSSLKFLKKTGTNNIYKKEEELTKIFLESINNINEIKIAGINSTEGRTATISLDFSPLDNAEISYILSKDYGIMTRCGLHCAPNAHKTLKTFPQGTVRFSFSYFNTKEEITYALDSINKIIQK